ncbi:hypothetical protein OC846_003776 [Tilletia horrida]|uniref:Pali-domain-containing protein n=1 Tax=Tilletia horrida TaxID=155126 RepID=A0AAN6JR09_9BASI|nr:hypothetical protein OC846_003776 [Tilletia horrida]KAK0553112.1 hypothetical protein OC845_001392 [Tilletia horrida]KAK0564840.1 hypothetical protein OC861_004079 [Tilletia horrida]
MARAFNAFSVIVGFCAFVLLVLCTVSLPTTLNDSTPFSFVSANNLQGINDVGYSANRARNLSRIRLGLWGYCTSDVNSPSDYDYCARPGHGYQVSLNATNGDTQASYDNANIQPSWTRGLAVHVVAMVVAAIAVILSIIPKTAVMLISFLVYLVAAVLALIAFIIDIVLFIYSRNRIHRVSPNASIYPGVAFYLCLISIPLLLIAGITACCGHRYKKRDEAYVPSSYAAGTTTTAPRSNNVSGAESYNMSTTKSSKQKVLDAFHASKH